MNSHDEGDIFPLREIIDDVGLGAFYASVFSGIALYEKADVKVASISLSQSKLLVNKVIQFRVERAHRLLRRYIAAGIRPFEPIAVRECGSRFSIISPPTAEIGEESLVMDGSHRVLAAHQAGLHEIVALAIRGIRLPSPASDAFPLDKIRIVKHVAHWTERTVNFRPMLFRPVPMNLDKLNRQLFDRTQIRSLLYGTE